MHTSILAVGLKFCFILFCGVTLVNSTFPTQKVPKQSFLSYVFQTSTEDIPATIRAGEGNDYYVLGTTWGSLGAQNFGSSDLMFSKFQYNQTTSLYTKQIGSSKQETAYALTIDANSYPYIGGSVRTEGNNNSDLYVAKINPSNGDVIWSVTEGTSERDELYDIAVDPTAYHLFAVGVTWGKFQGSGKSDGDAFLWKLTTLNGATVFVKQYLMTGEDYLGSIALFSAGFAYVAGATHTNLAALTNFDTNTPYFFAAKVDMSSGEFITSNGITTSIQFASPCASASACKSVVQSDPLGAVVFAAVFAGESTYSLNSTKSSTDIVVAKFTSLGNFDWAMNIGGGRDDYLTDMIVNREGTIFLSGYTQISDVQYGLLASVNSTGTVAWAFNVAEPTSMVQAVTIVGTSVLALGAALKTIGTKINSGGDDMFLGVFDQLSMVPGKAVDDDGSDGSDEDSTGDSLKLGLGLGLGLGLPLILAAVGLLAFIRHRKLKRDKRPKLSRTTSETQFETLEELTDIVIQEEIAYGNFGVVYTGKWMNTTEVALKALRLNGSFELFNNEARVLRKLTHPNIVKFLGIYKTDNEAYLVMEMVALGNLHKLLQKESETLGVVDLLDIAKQIAAGMVYLSAKRIVHKDLASRNVLVTSDPKHKYQVKIADFGLSNDISGLNTNTTSDESLFAVKWSAPEVIKSSMYSSQSDIWSFGVVLWEIFSFGAMPYSGKSNTETADFVLKGNRLSAPSICPDTIYTLMLECWKENPAERPSFDLIHNCVENALEQQKLLEGTRSRSTMSSPPLTTGSNSPDASTFSISNSSVLSRSDFIKTPMDNTPQKVNIKHTADEGESQHLYDLTPVKQAREHDSAADDGHSLDGSQIELVEKVSGK
eukprot:TRINITY_DN7027_c0_g1_i1.p1 TRINITY_DN7027_c0_g1~~TRINITY_DN7027_c0_g1_i1.p1  ORF type:complete len:880 (+),score=201.48 TRINITY_DN7027_c0_g1_i1:204-2843(+)